MHAERHTVTVTTGTGTGTGYTPAITGRVISIQYVKAGSGNFSDGVDMDITGEATGLVVWNDDDVNASVTVYPLAVAAKSANGDASTLSEVPVVLVNERLKIDVASGGNGTTGTFHVIVG